MYNYNQVLATSIAQLKEEKRYRIFTKLRRDTGKFPKAEYFMPSGQSKEVTIWCSNDYLGQGCNNTVIEAMCKTLQSSGSGAGGTRNISGNNYYHDLLEQRLASYHEKEAALLFSSGYVANEAAISSLANVFQGCVIFSDQKNHASIIAGIKASRSAKHIFKHNDIAELEQLLQRYSLSTPKLIIFESVYSMDGDFGAIKEIAALAKKYNALTYLDEVHAIGMYGKTGAGLAQLYGASNEVDIIQATLGKAIGCIGGYIAANSNIIDVVRSTASGFIFTTSMPPAIAAGALASIDYLATIDGDRLRKRQQATAQQLKNKLSAHNLPILQTPSHIVPLMVYDSYLCTKLSQELLNTYNIYLQPINYPTVEKGFERLRITPTPFHTKEMIDELVTALSQLWQKMHLPYAAP